MAQPKKLSKNLHYNNEVAAFSKNLTPVAESIRTLFGGIYEKAVGEIFIPSVKL